MKNDNNYVLEAFDYNFIIIISQRRSNGKISLNTQKNKAQSYWLFVKSVVTYARCTDKIQSKKAVKKCYKGEELGEGVG